jgi:hypothetical protein
VAKRGDRVAPPARKGEWELRHTTGSVEGWEEMCRQARGPVRETWDKLSTAPFDRSSRQHPLAGQLGTITIGGRALTQWQYEVTGAGRIWYCADVERKIVYLTMVSVGHPKRTESK